MSTPLTLSPSNDFAIRAKLRSIDPTTGAVGPLVTGPVTAFLATSGGNTATAADPSLSVSATMTDDGTWIAVWDGAVMTPALMDPLFSTGTPHVIVQKAGDVRVVAPFTYVPSRLAILT